MVVGLVAVSSALYLSRVPARSFTPEVRLWCAAYTAFLLTLAPPTAPDSVFLPWQKSSSFFSFFHSPLRPLLPFIPIAPTSPLFFRSSLFFSLFLLVLAFSVVISPSGLRSWLVINESRKNRRTEGGSVERRWPWFGDETRRCETEDRLSPVVWGIDRSRNVVFCARESFFRKATRA